MPIYFIRHGIKEYANGKGIPRFDPGIKNINPDIKLRLPINPSSITSSPFLRCRQTAQLLYPGSRINISKEFGEFLGHWPTIEESDLLPCTYKYYQGNLACFKESVEDFKKRIQNEVISLLERLPIESDHIVITHGFALDTIYRFCRKDYKYKTFYDNDPKQGFMIN